MELTKEKYIVGPFAQLHFLCIILVQTKKIFIAYLTDINFNNGATVYDN